MAKNDDELVREAVLRMLPGKAGKLSDTANKMHRASKQNEIAEQTEALGEFIVIHEEIAHILRVLNRNYELRRVEDGNE